MIRAARAVVLIMLVAGAMPAWSATTTVIIPLTNLRAPVIQNWLLDLLNANRLGIERDSIERLGVVETENAVMVEGDAASVEMIRTLVQSVDLPRRLLAVQIKMLHVSDPTPLLGTPRPAHTVALPDGGTVPAPGTVIEGSSPGGHGSSGYGGYVGGGYGGGGYGGGGLRLRSVAINPLVDQALVEKLIAGGEATVTNEPVLTTSGRMPATIAFHYVKPGEPGPQEHADSYSVTAAYGDGDLVTVELRFRHEGPMADAPDLGPLQYVARLGQPVAVCAIAEGNRPQTVYLITVSAVE